MTDLKKLISLLTNSSTWEYDTTAEVKRIDGQTAWVHIPGGVAETPVRLTIDAKVGDTVQMHVGNGKAWLTGNITAPPDNASAKIEEIDKTVEGGLRTIGTVKDGLDTINTLVHEYEDGVLVCKTGNTIGALVNADGSFDIVEVTWADGIPTAGTTVATYGYNSGELQVLLGLLTKTHAIVSHRSLTINDWNSLPFFDVGTIYGSEYTETATLEGDYYETRYLPSNLTVTVNGSETTDYTLYGNEITFNSVYHDAVITCTYTIANTNAYLTLGTRTGYEGNFSSVFGFNGRASEYCSAAFGANGVASGYRSFVEGNHCRASGNDSHAGGADSVASSTQSYAFGKGVKANYENLFAIGQFNNTALNMLFAVGNGTDDNNRDNALEVYKNGNIVVSGDITANGNPITPAAWTAITHTKGTWDYLEYRKVNGAMQVRGRASAFAWSGSTGDKFATVADIGTPNSTNYFLVASSARRTAKIYITTGGEIGVDYLWNGDGSDYTGSTWLQFDVQFSI